MPIPEFDHNHVLPPHLGSPTQPSDLSPYPCSIMELCKKFATSASRVEILKGLLDFREKMNQFDINNGFQWVDGSFVTKVETLENRPPSDIDIVTFYCGITPEEMEKNIIPHFPEFRSPKMAKNNFHVDHYAVDMCWNPSVTVNNTRYWIQLFTHTRDAVWKGILELPINTPAEDKNALLFLNSL